MVFQKIKIKKSLTLTDFIIGLLVVMVLFMGMFNYVSESMKINNLQFDQNGTYNISYTKMVEAQSEMDSFKTNIETRAKNVAEADSTWQTAINGLKGIGTILTAPLVFVSTSYKVTTAAVETLTGIPTYMVSIFLVGVAIVLLLIVIAAMMGGNPKL